MVALLLAAALFGGICSAVALPVEAAAGYSAAAEAGLSAAIDDTAAYLREQVPHPSVGEIGGEWTVLGLARSGRTLPESYYQEYCRALEERLLETGGVLDARKNTTYLWLGLALGAFYALIRRRSPGGRLWQTVGVVLFGLFLFVPLLVFGTAKR